jgi:hypothetical protein
LIVSCKGYQHKSNPIPDMAQRYGAETTAPDVPERLVCSKRGSREIGFGRDQDEAASGLLTRES